MAELRIGTSGWNYQHWKGLFYPPEVAQKRWLQFYAEHYNTAEVNYSFYRLPKPSTYENWRIITPPDFLFTLKCSRLITHTKRLNVLGDLWENFLRNAVVLENKLGPILCQFPESFKLDMQRLDEFLTSARSAVEHDLDIRLAVEFRHESWFTKEVYRLLERHNTALVIADSAEYPRADVHTADFAYYRYHGPTRLFASSYTRKQMEDEAKKMQKCLRQNMDTFAYFNNDGFGFAIKNSMLLKDLLGDRKQSKAG
jgi:uncharacterized protein YecE (DUF72 family)